MIALWQERQLESEGFDLPDDTLSLLDSSCNVAANSDVAQLYALPTADQTKSLNSDQDKNPQFHTQSHTRFRQQLTLAADVLISGVGLHSGIESKLRISPAPANSGLRFDRIDMDADKRGIEGRFDLVSDTLLCTKLSNGKGAELGTVEHLLSALRALEIDNAIISVDGPEVPVLDGSAVQILDALNAVGTVEQGAPRQVIRILEPITVGDQNCGATLKPGKGFEVDFTIRYDSSAIGEQSYKYAFDKNTYANEIANCRTFGFFEEVEKLRQMGLAKGGSLSNAVVIKDDSVMNPEGLRHKDEFVRHKILDAIGDLYLAGLQIEGAYQGTCSGHRVNNELLRALFDNPKAWALAYQSEDADTLPMAAQG